MHIETWYQFVIKKTSHTFVDEAVKLAVAFCEDGKIRSEIFWCRKKKTCVYVRPRVDASAVV